LNAQIFGGRFAPVTFSCAFVNLEFDRFVDAYFAHVRRNFSTACIDAVEQSLAAALEDFQPLVSPMNRELLVSTSSGWTAIFGNSVGISDCFTVSAVCARKFSVDTFAVVNAPDRLDRIRGGATHVYRSMQFQYFSAQAEEPIRTIASSNDGGRWTFISQGLPFEFERIEQFSSKKVRDRFGPQDVEAACNYFGVGLASDARFGSRIAKLTRNRPLPNARVMGYDEARDVLGIVLS